jgi:uncharacterized repeat protein (TIGR03803 family)
MHTNLGSAVSKTLATVAIAAILAVPGWSQGTEKILYNFTNLADGGYPHSGLTIDSKGDLYGTTSNGGSGAYCPCGTVFELSPGSKGTWTESTLYSFGSSFTDGNDPSSALIFDPKGNLYGMTMFGGASFQGTVYELSPGSTGTWTENILYSFTGGADGGSANGSRLSIDSAGNLYGVTSAGGVYGFGVAFELIAGTNGTWSEKVLHSFTGGEDGAEPYESSLELAGKGSIYGIAASGGAHDYGLVFGLTQLPDGSWSEKTIYAFTGSTGETFPISGLHLDGSGNLYGAANDVFELIHQSDGVWSKRTLHTFPGPPDGEGPQSPPVSDKSGNLYGTTYAGGSHYGTVYELMPGAGGTWDERVLYRFSGSGGDGTFPTIGPLSIDSTGNLYGTTQSGGASKAGIVYEITP